MVTLHSRVCVTFDVITCSKSNSLYPKTQTDSPLNMVIENDEGYWEKGYDQIYYTHVQCASVYLLSAIQ